MRQHSTPFSSDNSMNHYQNFNNQPQIYEKKGTVYEHAMLPPAKKQGHAPRECDFCLQPFCL